MLVAIILILAAAAYRLLGVWDFSLANFSPLMALAFCGAVYFRNRWMWLIPFAALSLSDLCIDHFYAVHFHYGWTLGAFLIRTACFAAALGLGWLVSRRKNWLNLFSGALAGSLLFYFVTNTASWAGDLYYAKTFAGWWQAMTVGHPEFPPTLWFFRNTLAGDLIFTAAFALAMECLALRRERPSLLRSAARSR
jgi:hypothetical protein